MHSLYWTIRRHIEMMLGHRPKARVQFAAPTRRLGSIYGGWNIALNSLDEESVVLSVGVGEDISFDLALIETFGCKVHAFDPTPRSAAWIRQQTLPTKLIFHQLALADLDGTLTLTLPADPKFVSCARVKQLGKGVDSINVPAARLPTLVHMSAKGVVDLLKIDIEGSEYQVIEDFTKHRIRPKHFLCEFHHGLYGYDIGDTERAVKRLNEIGYCIYHISQSGREYSFAHRLEADP